MQKITDVEIVKEIENGCNVLIKAMTPWHANSVEAAYLDLNLDFEPKIIVLCSYISPASCKINEDNFPHLKKIGARFYEYDITRFEGMKSKITFLIRQLKQVKKRIEPKRKMFIFSQSGADTYWNTMILEHFNDINICNVIVDEGVETYVPRKKYDSAIKKLTSFFYEKKFQIKRDMLFFKNKKIYINDSIISRYRTVYSNHMEQINEKDLNEIGNSILICFAPINEVKEMSVDEAKKLIISIVNMAHKYGIKVAVKLHPRETEMSFYETIGCYVLQSTSVSMEVLIEKAPIKPKMVVGLITTGLITANVFWNVQAISFLNYVNSTSTPKKHRDFNKRFMKTFKEYVVFVNSFKEFEDKLKVENSNE